ncbi:chorismate-binding protein [Actinobacteria bacterium YIM 96077]|uniref:anthranilate synthase n=1 Tax=Phytoactinopolyspora halophila TaxID=1981511 RepID=A0A329QAI7_9ACTN|nr:anthranilate synthase family protein [Phytoactinopolyspora halophila]AYY12469.1 chorismate-binding protein [Actinobacteria bacterium YIM 96077]RAW09334.1 chorismate-binding protein [Phytoactinopolyspora halophila]
MIPELTALLASPAPPPFAVVRREGREGVELMLGDVIDVDQLADVPLPSVPGTADTAPGSRSDSGSTAATDSSGTGGTAATGGSGTDTTDASQVLALIPYRQVSERGFACHDDAAPVRCLVVRDRHVLDVEDCLAAIPDAPLDVTADGFDIDDDAYARLVGDVIRDEIGRGEGANFVIRRDYRARIHGASPHVAALRLFRRLLIGEPNAYWTFAAHTNDGTMVGATPERHVSVAGGTVVMNPISGTYRPPDGVATPDGLLRFLADPKETEELFMVVDEELKMMSHVCDRGGQVLGPFLKEMGHLVHTEYLLEGQTDLDVRDVLRETMFAPTVTGSPLENAARVITRYESSGRGYYAGVAALLEAGSGGRVDVDAPILIRTAYIDPAEDAHDPAGDAHGPAGDVRVPVGATLVRHSIAANEVAETHAKAAGMLAALGLLPPAAGSLTESPAGSLSRSAAGGHRGDDGAEAGPDDLRAEHPEHPGHPGHPGGSAGSGRSARLADHPGVTAALAARNATLAPFWLRRQDTARRDDLAGCSALIIDAEDRWTAMLAHLLRHLGMAADVCSWDGKPGDAARHDLLICGPGPGDPRDLHNPRMARMDALVRARLEAERPLLAVCLSHQVLAARLGLPIAVLDQPYQGTQLEIDFFGRRTRAGFYNTFAAWTSVPSPHDPRRPSDSWMPTAPAHGEVTASPTLGTPPGMRIAASSPGVEIAADDATGEVYALRGPGFASVQFHVESILSVDGVDLLAGLVQHTMTTTSSRTGGAQ